MQFRNHSCYDGQRLMNQQITTSILKGNMYSLTSVILNKLPLAAPSNYVHVHQMKSMETLVTRIRYIWRTHGRTGWDVIGLNLQRMWTVRAMMVNLYLRRNPQSALNEISSRLTHWNGTNTKNAQRNTNKKNLGCRCDIM